MMDGIPKISDFSTAADFISAFELHMDCFLMTKSFDASEHDNIRVKFLKFAMSKSPGFNALGVDGRSTYESLKRKVSLLLQPTSTPLKSFFELDCCNFKSATDYIVESKKLLSCFIDDETVMELLIKQRVVELLPSDAGLMLGNASSNFTEFMKQLSFMWNLLSSSPQSCLSISKNVSQKRRFVPNSKAMTDRCYACDGYGHYARDCPNNRNRNRQPRDALKSAKSDFPKAWSRRSVTDTTDPDSKNLTE